MNLVLLIIGDIVFVAAGFLLNAFLGRTLSPDDYGIFASILTYITLLNLLISFGLPLSISKHIYQKKIRDKKSIRDLLIKTGVLQLLVVPLIGIGFFIYLNSINLTNSLQLNQVVAVSVLAALIMMAYMKYSLLNSAFNGSRKYGVLSKSRGLYSVIKLIFVLVGAYYWGIIGAIFGFWIGAEVSVLATYYIFSRNFKKSRKVKVGWSKARELVIASIMPTLYIIFFTIFRNTDVYFLNAKVTNLELQGFYLASYTLSRVPYFFTVSLSQSVISMEFFKRKDLLRLISIVVFIGMLSVILLGDRVGQMIYGSNYEFGNILILQTAAVFQFVIYQFISVDNVRQGKQRLNIITSVIILATLLLSYAQLYNGSNNYILPLVQMVTVSIMNIFLIGRSEYSDKVLLIAQIVITNLVAVMVLTQYVHLTVPVLILSFFGYVALFTKELDLESLKKDIKVLAKGRKK